MQRASWKLRRDTSRADKGCKDSTTFSTFGDRFFWVWTVTALENDQLTVTFLGTSGSLIGNGQEARCGMKRTPGFLWREQLISPYRNLGSLYKNGNISYLAASSPTNVFWRLLTTFPCAINVSFNSWFLGEQKTNLRWKYYFQRFCCSCYVDFLQISLCTCGEGLQKLAMNWIAQWSKESCVYAETVSVAVITRITKQNKNRRFYFKV